MKLAACYVVIGFYDMSSFPCTFLSLEVTTYMLHITMSCGNCENVIANRHTVHGSSIIYYSWIQ